MIFAILTICGALMSILGKVEGAGYSIILMLGSNVFRMFYRDSKRKIEKQDIYRPYKK